MTTVFVDGDLYEKLRLSVGTVVPRFIVTRLVQSRLIFTPMNKDPLKVVATGMLTVVRLAHPLNILLELRVVATGRFIVTRLVQFPNIIASLKVVAAGRFTAARLVQLAKIL